MSSEWLVGLTLVGLGIVLGIMIGIMVGLLIGEWQWRR